MASLQNLIGQLLINQQGLDVLPQPVDRSTSLAFNLASLIIILMLIGLYATWW